MSEFNPYLSWLGIRDQNRPINHYRLLGLELFESDPDVISTAADRQMAHVQTYKNGPHGAESQELLNELARARRCLLTPDKKSQYDQSLQLQPAEPPAQPLQQAATEANAPIPMAIPVSADASSPEPNLASPEIHADSNIRQKRQRRESKQFLWSLIGWISGGLAAVVVAGLLITSGWLDSIRGNQDQEKPSGVASLKSSDIEPTFLIPDKERPTKDDAIIIDGKAARRRSNRPKTNSNSKKTTSKKVIKRSQPVANKKTREAKPKRKFNLVKYAYYHGNWKKLPDFSKLKPIRSGYSPYFDVQQLKNESRKNHFGMVVTAYWFAPQNSEYKFELTCGDGAKLWVDQKIVVEHDGEHERSSKTGSIELERGLHRIHMEYFNATSVACLELRVTGGRIDNVDVGKLLRPWPVGKPPETLKFAASDSASAGSPVAGTAPKIQPFPDRAKPATELTDVFAASAEEQAKLPTPDLDELARAAQFLQRRYGPAITAINRATDSYRVSKLLIERLIRESGPEEDPSIEFAMLFEAKRLAIAAGDATSAVNAVRTVGRRFQIDYWSELHSVFDGSAGNLDRSIDKQRFRESLDEVINEAKEERQYDVAEKLISSALAMAKTTKDPNAVRKFKEMRSEVRELSRIVSSARKASKKLQRSRRDSKSNEVLAEYHLVVSGDLSLALGHWANTKDEQFVELAAAYEKLETDNWQQQAKLADRWMGLVKSNRTKLEQKSLQEAISIYEDVVSRVAGESKEQIIEKLDKAKQLLE